MCLCEAPGKFLSLLIFNDQSNRILAIFFLNWWNKTINTFASQCLVFEEKIEPFFLENALNLKHEFLYDKQENFVKLHAFSKRNRSFFPQKSDPEKQKC